MYVPAADDGAPDAELLERVRQRDTGALAILYDRHHRLALGLARRLLRNQQLAEDVVQDAFLALWRHGGRYDLQRGSVRNWLLSIVHHRAVDYLRRQKGVQPEANPEDHLVGAAEPELWEQAAARIERDRVRAALRRLPAEQRQTIELAYFAGLTCQQIADQTGAPLGTVKGRMRLALQKLRALLEPESLEMEK